MSWDVELRQDGMFTVSAETGTAIFDAAFRPWVSQELREAVAHQVAEAPAMLATLKGVAAELRGVMAEAQSMLGEDRVARLAPGIARMIALLGDKVSG